MENKKKMALIAEIMKSYKGKKNEEKMFEEENEEN
jgi:hypothetical protein